MLGCTEAHICDLTCHQQHVWRSTACVTDLQIKEGAISTDSGTERQPALSPHQTATLMIMQLLYFFKNTFSFLCKQISLHSTHRNTGIRLICVVAASRLQQFLIGLITWLGHPTAASPGAMHVSVFPPVTGRRTETAFCSRLVPALF